MPTDETFLDRPLGRRTLIRRGIAFVSTAALMPPAFVRAVFDEASVASAAEAPRRVLVILQLGGGNDGLNTVVPYRDGAYHDARRQLGLNPESLLHLNDEFALHPKLTGIKELYDQQRVAVVLGAGYPHPNRSHFRAMDIWHTGSTDERVYTGWLGRLLDATRYEQRALWHAANVGADEPLSLKSTSSFVPSLASVPAYALQVDPQFPRQADRRITDWLRLYRQQAEGMARQAEYGGQLAFVSETGLEAYESTVDLRRNATGYQAKTEYPRTPLASALQTVAGLVVSNLGTTIAYVTTGGFDTHAGQSGTQDRLLGVVSDAVRAFYADLDGHGLSDGVTTLGWTEFGRRVRQNGSGGTDHGTATPTFLIGGHVRGGIYGEQPSLTRLDRNGDLQFTTDFRSIYATIISGLFGTDPADVLGARYPVLPVFA
ncbi:MAG: DUF1501 domain-containing protein [Chloroflexi bacterium]|nr:DUF1501 domain-containing protein [Chloroflexota bacterium]